MADKPKTYAQQAQELRDQLQQKDEQLNEALQRLSFVDEMQAEIAHLKEQLAFNSKQTEQGTVNSKAQSNDLLQRAESAEQGLRNFQALSKQQIDKINALEQQLDIAGAERDKNLGKDRKIELLSEELRNSNLQVAKLNQQIKDLQQKTNEDSARQEKEVLYLRELTKAQSAKLSDLHSAIGAAPDVISGLKALIARG